MNTNESDERPATAMQAAVVVRLPHDLREALRERAAQDDRTVASLMRLAARAYLGRDGR